MDSVQKNPKLFYGWWIVGASFLITMYNRGVVGFGFTAIFQPIADEFGWSYTQISLATTIRSLIIFLLAPLVGFLVDRWGPKRLVFSGVLITGLGLMSLSRISSLSMFYLAFVLISVGRGVSNFTVMSAAVANWFRKRIGLAIGVLTCGVGLGGLMIPLVTMLTDTFKWQTAIFSLGLGMLVLGLPLSLFIRHKPEQYGYLPDGEVRTTLSIDESLVSARSDLVNVTAKQALLSRSFWHLAIGAACQAFAVSTIIVHIMPYLSSIGFDRSTSSLVATILPIVSISGRLGFGWLGDRVSRKQLLTIAFILMSLGLFSLSWIANIGTWLLPIFITLYGIGWGGCITPRIGLLGEYFGYKRIGTILGFNFAIMMIGGMIGSPLAGWAFDKWGSYQGIWFTYSVMLFVGALLTMSIPRSPAKQL